MKITELKTFVVDAYRANYVFVKIHTDSGIYGVGEGTVEMKERTVAAAIDELGRYLIGQDPFRIEHHIEMMNRESYWRTGVILRNALAAVEAAADSDEAGHAFQSEAGHLFRREAGQRSDLKPATPGVEPLGQGND